ncbi:hypothetical protein AgCh_033063 [Apium graveolens]
MEECRPSFRSAAGERRLEIVSGKVVNAGKQMMYSSPEMSSISSSRVNRLSQVVASSSPAKPWGFNDPEMKRKKRIAKYKVYSIEGRFKASFRSGFRWIKTKCSEFIHGY